MGFLFYFMGANIEGDKMKGQKKGCGWRCHVEILELRDILGLGRVGFGCVSRKVWRTRF